MTDLLNVLKKLPIDFGQASLSEVTEGKQIALRLVPLIKVGKALDVGCREGHQSEWLKEQGYFVESVDIEPNYTFGKVLDVNDSLPYGDDIREIAKWAI